MKPNISEIKQIAFRSENPGSYEVYNLKITLSEIDIENILKTQQVLKDNKFISSAKIDITGEVIYLTDEGEETREWRVDVEQFLIYTDSFYYYAQNKWDASDQIESEELQLEN
jgi:hypothetical protein